MSCVPPVSRGEALAAGAQACFHSPESGQSINSTVFHFLTQSGLQAAADI